MIPIIVFIGLAMIFSCFTLGFLYNDVFIYAAAVLCIIFGLVFAFDGIHLKTGETIESYTDPFENLTNTETTYQYENFNSLITNGIGTIFILLGIGFVYFENRGRNDGKDQWGQDGKWL